MMRAQQRKAQTEYEADQYEAAQQAVYAPPPPPASAPPVPPAAPTPPQAVPGGTDATTERLRELSRLHADGTLTDAEFASAAAEILK